MHKHFLKIHRQEKVSDESYRKSLKSINISFTKLGEENVGFVKNTHIIDVKERKILIKRKMKWQLWSIWGNWNSFRMSKETLKKLPCRCRQEWKKCKTLFFDEYTESINASGPSWYQDDKIYQADNNNKSKHCTPWWT